MQIAQLVVGTANLVVSCAVLGLGIVALKKAHKMKLEADTQFAEMKKTADNKVKQIQNAARGLLEI